MANIPKKPTRKTPQLPEDELNQFILDSLRESGMPLQPEPMTNVPSVDIYSTPTEIIIEIELPGVKKDDIDISILRDTLTVKAVKYELFEEEKVNYVCMERSFGKIVRSVDIPYPTDSAQIKAVFKNGVLTVTLPRVEDKRSRSRTIPVESH